MKKMLPWLITILLAITLIAIVAVILFNSILGGDNSNDPATNAANSANNVEMKKLDADERVEVTSELADIKTNLADPEYIGVMGFAFQLDDKSTKEDFDKIKDIQIKPIIIRTLSDMTPEQLKGSKGKDDLNTKLLNLINKKLEEFSEGKLINVETTNFIVTKL
ncbi:flagellar basal body-associated FliL family protein [Paenibacillus oenotherae]|uniref:Flagellar protein FliL n=1 Tax=Paenibacillus oenotherae TaxID=1435645 RepID=A0ABS7D0K4_9BACL|nr:flagellar basal body-associated FliL family protein [Paenibacillus oenotherae]MBW7473291.1 flagellar basal body-associated FliL family protein [Paenibacillus oenotherae]